MGVKGKDKKAAEVLDLLVTTSYDDVQISYEVGLSVTAVKKIIKDAQNYYHVRTRDLLVECLEQDVY